MNSITREAIPSVFHTQVIKLQLSIDTNMHNCEHLLLYINITYMSLKLQNILVTVASVDVLHVFKRFC